MTSNEPFPAIRIVPTSPDATASSSNGAVPSIVDPMAGASQIAGRITTLFFDLDNTLIPTRKADTKACKRMCDILQRAPHHFDETSASAVCEHFLRTFRACPDNPDVPLDAWRTGLWAQALPAAHRDGAPALYAQWLELRFRYLALTTATVALLQRFHADGFRLALITNGPSAAQWEKVRRLNVARLFELVLVSGDLPWEKPDRRIFEAACRAMHVRPAECVMIGDKLDTDIQGGIEAQLGGTIWTPLSVDETCARRRHQPTFTVHNLQDMRPLLAPISSALKSNGTAGPNGAVSAGAALASGRRRGSIGKHLHHNFHLRVASLPDLESGNSNSSDGS